MIGGDRIVKFGKAVSMTETAEMEYVGYNTIIPVPKIHFACRGVVIMDFINAETLDSAQFHFSEDHLLGNSRTSHDSGESLMAINQSNPHGIVAQWTIQQDALSRLASIARILNDERVQGLLDSEEPWRW